MSAKGHDIMVFFEACLSELFCEMEISYLESIQKTGCGLFMDAMDLELIYFWLCSHCTKFVHVNLSFKANC